MNPKKTLHLSNKQLLQNHLNLFSRIFFYKEDIKIEIKDKMEEALKTLTEREEKIIRMRFGLIDGKNYTLEEIGQYFPSLRGTPITRERVRQIIAKAIRKLEHPGRSKKLRFFIVEELLRAIKVFEWDRIFRRNLKSFKQDGI